MQQAPDEFVARHPPDLRKCHRATGANGATDLLMAKADVTTIQVVEGLSKRAAEEASRA